jgi:integrase
MAHLKASLRWGERVGLLVKAPLFPKLQIAKGDAMKGRPITAEEFDRMIAVVPKVVGDDKAAEWSRYLTGLWLSGFRITESLALSWDHGAGITVDLSGRFPVAHIAAASQKSKRTETLPLAPEFAAMFDADAERSGYVFNPLQANGKRASRAMAIRTVGAIGKAAGVKVWTSKNGKVKCATAHDLRRAFGLRWSSRVMPAVLQQMMRHATIETTMKFYVGRDAQTAAGVIAEAFAKTQSGNTSGNNAVSGVSAIRS